MGKKAWTTPVQRTWLENQIPDFVRAQQDKTVSLFMKDMYDKWEQKWPTPPPTEEEVKHAKGNSEKASAIKRKGTESRVKYWFHNHTRASSSGSGVRGVLKLSASPKLAQPWQAYLNKFQDTKLKQNIEHAWEDYLLEVPEGKRPEKTKFEIRNRVAQILYEQETDEVKLEVEEHRQKMRHNRGMSDPSRNKVLQRSIDMLPRTLQLAADSIASQTGWSVTIIAGGPNPRMGGTITTLAIHEGKTVDGITFDKFLCDDGFETKIMATFDEFLNQSFDPNEYDSRAIHAESIGSALGTDNEGSEDEDEQNAKRKQKMPKKKVLKTHGDRDLAKIKKLLIKMGVYHSDESESEGPNLDSETNSNPAVFTSTLNPTQSGAVDVGTVSESSGLSTVVPAIPHRSSSSTPEVQPDDGLGSKDSDLMQTHSASDASPASNDDSGAMLMVEGGLEGGLDVVASVSKISEKGPTPGDLCAPSDATSPHSPTLDPSFSDSWFAPWLSRFLTISGDITWQGLVWNWVQFETCGPPEGRLPTASRPEEVLWWMKRKRLPELCPQIERLSEFAAVWKQWWVKMQPPWRERESLIRILPADADWEPILRGGPNGFALVVLVLSWWIHSAKADEEFDVDLRNAIDDVNWVVLELIGVVTATLGSKRGREADTEPKSPKSKRARTAI